MHSSKVFHIDLSVNSGLVRLFLFLMWYLTHYLILCTCTIEKELVFHSQENRKKEESPKFLSKAIFFSYGHTEYRFEAALHPMKRENIAW